VQPTGSDRLGPVSPLQAVLGGRPFYSALLDLRHIEPNGVQRALLAEGSIVAGILLALGDVASAWVILALPVTVAVVVKAHDVVSGLLPEQTGQPVVREPKAPRPARQPPGTRQVDPAAAEARARAKKEAADAKAAAKKAAREARTAAKAQAAQRKAEAKKVSAERAAEAKAAAAQAKADPAKAADQAKAEPVTPEPPAVAPQPDPEA
jgi:flagellar biosynthesis GTPase FlhF